MALNPGVLKFLVHTLQRTLQAPSRAQEFPEGAVAGGLPSACLAVLQDGNTGVPHNEGGFFGALHTKSFNKLAILQSRVFMETTRPTTTCFLQG